MNAGGFFLTGAGTKVAAGAMARTAAIASECASIISAPGPPKSEKAISETDHARLTAKASLHTLLAEDEQWFQWLTDRSSCPVSEAERTLSLPARASLPCVLSYEESER